MSLTHKKRYLALIAAIVAMDQVSKYIVTTRCTPYEPVPVIKGLFRIWPIRNSGAVWGLFSEHASGAVPLIITILAALALVMVGVFFFKAKPECRLEVLSFSFILGGAIGNLIDRIRIGYVVDFLDFHFRNYHFPTFNVADSFITCGVILLAWSMWRGKCTQF